MLLMKKQYFDAIRSGTKRTTLRYWRSARLKDGAIHLVPGLGRIRIDRVIPVDWNDLTDDDARTDGFLSLDELRSALNLLYPHEERKNRTLYQIHFSLLPVGDQRETFKHEHSPIEPDP